MINSDACGREKRVDLREKDIEFINKVENRCFSLTKAAVIWENSQEYWVRGLHFEARSIEWERYFKYRCQHWHRKMNSFIGGGKDACFIWTKIWGLVVSANVIIYSKYRKKGYGSEALNLLCSMAKNNGISVLYDDIAIDNSAITLFLKHGFVEEYRTGEKIVLKKEL